jgi:hypothetical protein
MAEASRHHWADRRYRFSKPATTLIIIAMIEVPKTNESSAWCNAVLRMDVEVRFVSDTWYVILMVNARYAKSR